MVGAENMLFGSYGGNGCRRIRAVSYECKEERGGVVKKFSSASLRIWRSSKRDRDSKKKKK